MGSGNSDVIGCHSEMPWTYLSTKCWKYYLLKLFYRFLILDPHYTGGEDLKVIIDKVS